MQERLLLIKHVIILHLERVETMSVENGTTGVFVYTEYDRLSEYINK